MDKGYIEKSYKQAILEFQCASTEDDQWEARKTMARLEAIAAQEHGFAYADSLEIMKKGVRPD